MIIAGYGGLVDGWRAQSGDWVFEPLFHSWSGVKSFQFSPDGTRIVASHWKEGPNIGVWDISTRESVFALDGHDKYVDSVSCSPNGTLIASGSRDKTIIVWDADTGEKRLGPLTGHSDWVNSVHFSPDSTRLVSGSGDRTIRIWDIQTGEMMFEIVNGHEGDITSVEYSPDGTRILSYSDDKTVRIHDARSPAERALMRSDSEIGDWTINQDGWVVDDQSRLLVWVPGDLRRALLLSETRMMIASQGYVRLNFDKSRMGESWTESYKFSM